MGALDEDLDALIIPTGGSISKGEFLKAAGTMLKIVAKSLAHSPWPQP